MTKRSLPASIAHSAMAAQDFVLYPVPRPQVHVGQTEFLIVCSVVGDNKWLMVSWWATDAEQAHNTFCAWLSETFQRTNLTFTGDAEGVAGYTFRTTRIDGFVIFERR